VLDREPVSTRLRAAGVGMEMMDMGGGQMMGMPPEWTGWLRPRHLRHVGGDDGGGRRKPSSTGGINPMHLPAPKKCPNGARQVHATNLTSMGRLTLNVLLSFAQFE
jgi:hypothetical protein